MPMYVLFNIVTQKNRFWRYRLSIPTAMSEIFKVKGLHSTIHQSELIISDFFRLCFHHKLMDSAEIIFFNS